MRSETERELLQRIGGHIRLHRLRREQTIAQLAKAVAVDAAYLGELERGRENVSVTTLEAIARELQVALADLVKPL